MNRAKYLAEVIGTFSLVYAGCCAIIVNDVYGGVLGHIGVSFVFGLVVMAMIYAVGNVSGAHLNPAVTVGFFLSRRLSGKAVAPYIVSQLIGALIAAGLLRVMFPEHETLGATLPAGSAWQSFAFEVVLTFILMFVILNVSTGHREKGIMAGAAIGATVALDALFGGPVSGASMNPARSLGPALASGHLESIWIYLTAPVLGALLALKAFHMVQGKERCAAEPKSDQVERDGAIAEGSGATSW